jgi:arabinose-5-phosphate isomerase
MDYLEKARKVLAIERDELGRLSERLDGRFTEAISIFLKALDSGRKIVVLGVGKSGHIGEKIAATMTSTGSRAVVLNSLNALHGDLGLVEDGDVILALSYGGETDELLAVLPAIKRFDVQIVSMTGNLESSLARFSSVTLDVSVTQEACPLGLAPTSSTTAMLVLGDALAMVLLELRGFRREDFAKFHPSGRLGRRLLLKAGDVMRPGNRVPLCQENQTVREALAVMTKMRCGAAVIVDSAGTLSGIFTQGDFARKFQLDSGIGDAILSNVMTKNPISLRDDAPAVDVLKLIDERHIDDIVVVDAARRPVGMVDSQDLSRFQLI